MQILAKIFYYRLAQNLFMLLGIYTKNKVSKNYHDFVIATINPIQISADTVMANPSSQT